MKLGINSNSTKSVTFPSLSVIKFHPLSPKFPTAPERININGEKWKSDKAIFSNAILQFKQVKIEINSLEVTSLKDELRFKSSLNYLVLDDN